MKRAIFSATALCALAAVSFLIHHHLQAQDRAAQYTKLLADADTAWDSKNYQAAADSYERALKGLPESAARDRGTMRYLASLQAAQAHEAWDRLAQSEGAEVLELAAKVQDVDTRIDVIRMAALHLAARDHDYYAHNDGRRIYGAADYAKLTSEHRWPFSYRDTLHSDIAAALRLLREAYDSARTQLDFAGDDAKGARKQRYVAVTLEYCDIMELTDRMAANRVNEMHFFGVRTPDSEGMEVHPNDGVTVPETWDEEPIEDVEEDSREADSKVEPAPKPAMGSPRDEPFTRRGYYYQPSYPNLHTIQALFDSANATAQQIGDKELLASVAYRRAVLMLNVGLYGNAALNSKLTNWRDGRVHEPALSRDPRPLLQRVLRDHKGSAYDDEARFLLGYVAYYLNDFAAARTEFAQLEKDFPKSRYIGEARRLVQVIEHPQLFSSFDSRAMIRPGEHVQISVYARNVSSVQVSLRPLDLGTLLKGHTGAEHVFSELSELEKLPAFNECLGTSVMDQSFALNPTRKHFYEFRDGLSLYTGTPGVYVLEIKGGEITERKLMQVADLSLVRRRTPQGDTLWLTTGDGHPVEGALLAGGYHENLHVSVPYLAEVAVDSRDPSKGTQRVVQYRDERRMVNHPFSAMTDAHGLAGIGKAPYDVNNFWCLVDTGTGCFLINDKHDPEHIEDTPSWLPAVVPEPARDIASFVYTDRPVYRPGDTAHLKLVTRLPMGEGRLEGEAVLLRVMHSGVEQFRAEVRLNEFGTALAQFEIPHGAPVGTYDITAESPRLKPASFRMRVLEYFKKDVRLTVDSLRHPMIVGTSGEVVVRFSYLAGGWVQGGDVSVTVYAQPLGLPRFSAAAGKGRTNMDGEYRLALDTEAISKAADGRFTTLTIYATGTGPGGQTVSAQGELQLSGSGLGVSCTWPQANWISNTNLEVPIAITSGAGNRLASKGECAIYRITDQSSLLPAEWRNPSLRLESTSQFTLAAYTERLYIGLSGRSGRYRVVISGEAGGERFVQSHDLVLVGKGAFENSTFAMLPEFNQSDATRPMRVLLCQPRAGSVLLSRHRDGNEYEHQTVSAAGQIAVIEHAVRDTDAPHYHLSARAVRGGTYYAARAELTVKPASRRVQLAVRFDKEKYLPGEEATADIFAMDRNGAGVRAEVTLSVWDAALREFATPVLDTTNLYDHFFAGVTRFVATDAALHSRTRVAPTRHSSVKVTRWKVSAMPPGSFFYGSLSWLTTHAINLVDFTEEPEKNAGPKFYALDAEDSINESPMPDGVAEDPYYGESSKVGVGGGGGRGGSGGFAHRRARGGGGAGRGDSPERRNFQDSAFFHGRLLTDENGVATVTFTLPDNLTEWSVEAIAVDKVSAVGQFAGSFKVAKPVSARMVGPRALTEGDEVELCALVQNLQDESVAVSTEVSLNLEGHTSPLKMLNAAAPGGTFMVEAGRTQEVRFRVKVEKPGIALLKVQVLDSSGLVHDSLDWRYSVQPRGVPMVTVTRFAMDARTASLTVTPELPRNAIAGRSTAEIQFDGTLLSQLVDALPGLVSYPYGCAEQTTNRFVPLLSVLDVLRANKLSLYDISKARMNYSGASPADQWPEALTNQLELQKMVNVGFGKLREYQNYDGGWGWFGGDGSAPHLSATVLQGMADARRISRGGAGISLPASEAAIDHMLHRGIEFILQLDHPSLDATLSARALRAAAEAMAQLPAQTETPTDEQGKPVKTQRQRLQQALTLASLRTEMGAAAWANLAIAMHSQGRERDAQSCVSQLEKLGLRQGDTVLFSGGNQDQRWHDTAHEAQSDAVNALALVSPKSAIAQAAVDGLVAARRGNGWGNTRATGAALRGMAAWMGTSAGQAEAVQVQVDYGKHALGSYQRTAANALEDRTRFGVTAVEFSKATGFSLKRSGKGAVTGSLVVRSLVPETEFNVGQENGLRVIRDYRRRTSTTREVEVEVQDSRGNVLRNYTETRIVHEYSSLREGDELKVGDVVSVRISLTGTQGDRYLCIEDQRPPCFEPIANKWDEDGKHRASGGLYLTKEVRDHTTNFFVTELPRGSLMLEYDCVVVAEGKFVALPARAFDMYNEARNGYCDPQQMTVTGK